MKNLSFKILLCALVTGALSLQAATDINSIVEKGLQLARLSPKTGCNIVGMPGRGLALLSTENKEVACVICADEWKTTNKHPMALQTVCGTGPLSEKQRALVSKALNVAVISPDTGCELLGKFGRSLNILDKDQRIQACTFCGDKWDKHPQAKAAVCRESDLIEEQNDTSEPKTETLD